MLIFPSLGSDQERFKFAKAALAVRKQGIARDAEGICWSRYLIGASPESYYQQSRWFLRLAVGTMEQVPCM